MKIVLTHKPKSLYDDLPWERYHFPRTYLRQIQQAIGELIVYYEPRRESIGDAAYRGRQAYFATARLVGVRPDPKREDHFYANLDEYVEFEQPVPFRVGTLYYERNLAKEDGSTNRGAFGRAVRKISDVEFDEIWRAGFVTAIIQPAHQIAIGQGLQDAPPASFWPLESDVLLERPDAERVLSSRAFRDRAFANAVQRAYDRTCAFTGLRLINGGGRTETEAAHIRPVEENGPDTVRNGLALSSTVHWMFDRGLISVAADGLILVKTDRVPEPLQRLLHRDRKIRLPPHPWLQPAPVFLEYHRRRHGFDA